MDRSVMPEGFRFDEFELIERFKRFQNLSSRVVKGIGDDAAVLSLDAKRYQLFTTDMLVEGVHFAAGTPGKLVGHKALACNISDIAVMGGLPTFAVVSIGVPMHGPGRVLPPAAPFRPNRTLTRSSGRGPAFGVTRPGCIGRYLEDIYKGMASLARKFNISIVGGDTVKADKLVINVALLGEVEKKNLVLRGGARPGDIIFVSGPLGGTLKSGKHLNFTPRVKEARFLVENFKPTAMMDISDGLAGDLRHILKASRVGARIDGGRVSRNPGVFLEEALRGGEDFELLFTLSSARARKLVEWTHQHKGFRFTPIGEVTASRNKLYLKGARGAWRLLHGGGFTHF